MDVASVLAHWHAKKVRGIRAQSNRHPSFPPRSDLFVPVKKLE